MAIIIETTPKSWIRSLVITGALIASFLLFSALPSAASGAGQMHSPSPGSAPLGTGAVHGSIGISDLAGGGNSFGYNTTCNLQTCCFTKYHDCGVGGTEESRCYDNYLSCSDNIPHNWSWRVS